MSADPIFAATPNAKGVLTNAAADASLTAPANVATAFTAGLSGSRVEQIRIAQVLTTTAAGIINIFLHDGATYHLFDAVAYPAGTVSTTALVAPSDLYYPNLVLPTGWTIKVTNTAAVGTGATAATHKVVVLGADF